MKTMYKYGGMRPETEEYGGGGMYYGKEGLKMVEKDGKKVPFFMAENGGMRPDEDRMTSPPMGRDRFANDQYFADKGILAQLRQDMRKENRMANREGRRTGSFPARPSDVSFLLDGLSSDRFNREDMMKKGFRNESARMMGRNALLAALGIGISEYSKTPKTVPGVMGPGGQQIPTDLNTLQRIGLMLGLGPY